MIFLGLTVLTEDPNRRDSVSQQYTRSKIRIDSTTGNFTEIEKAKASRMVRTFEWFMPDRASIAVFLAFRNERQGRLVPFWVPTWHHDLILDHDIVAGSSLVVRNVGYTRYKFDTRYTWRRYIAFIQIGAGIQYIRRIDNATETPTRETLTLDTATPATLVKGQWMLSFLTLCRLDKDEVPMHWHLPTAAESSFDIREIPNEMPQVPTT